MNVAGSRLDRACVMRAQTSAPAVSASRDSSSREAPVGRSGTARGFVPSVDRERATRTARSGRTPAVITIGLRRRAPSTALIRGGAPPGGGGGPPKPPPPAPPPRGDHHGPPARGPFTRFDPRRALQGDQEAAPR